jgi:hypothetical protein
VAQRKSQLDRKEEKKKHGALVILNPLVRGFFFSLLQSSKLPKVLQRVVELEESKVPLDARYNIRARAHALQEKWRQQFELSGQFHHPQTFNDTKEPDRDDEKENAELASAKKSEEAAPKAMKSEKDMLLSWYRTVHRLGKPRQS